MGTNYYIKCIKCKCEQVHIGKQSSGWSFSSNHSKEDVEALLRGMEEYERLENEYGKEIGWNQFWKSIKVGGWRIKEGEFS